MQRNGEGQGYRGATAGRQGATVWYKFCLQMTAASGLAAYCRLETKEHTFNGRSDIRSPYPSSEFEAELRPSRIVMVVVPRTQKRMTSRAANRGAGR